ncbi:MAG TPA: Fic family protein [Candidatus Saccharimonadales bacterium]|nr:Fic family protein [Candidatus Saccharimonadales bacterium]
MVKASTKPKSATSYKDTAFGILSRSKIVTLEAEGVKRAQEYTLILSNKRKLVTPQLVLDLHKKGFGFIFPAWAGKFRKIEVTVGDYEPPQFIQIPELIKNLCDDLAERLKHLPQSENGELFLSELIILLAWFQHRFVWIHPFQDYNGRIARLLTNLILLNLGFPIITIIADTGEERDQYVAAMKAADQHDFSKLEALIADALLRNLEKV